MPTTPPTSNAHHPLLPHIHDVPDFPKPGIVFKDITPLLADPAALSLAVELMANPFRGRGITRVVGAESRGFIFGTAIAQSLSVGFVPVRKPGKLPRKTLSQTYDLEYGTDTLELHHDAVRSGDSVLLVDDLLATGGTMDATAELIASTGAKIAGIAVLVELAFLPGRARIAKHVEQHGADLHAVIRYEA